MAIKSKEDQREHARDLYMFGVSQGEIAEKVKVTRQTVSRWIAEGDWDKRRAAQSITRTELVNNLLTAIAKEIESLNADNDPGNVVGASDRLSKLAAAIEKLDKKASVVDVIEVFLLFSKWLQGRMAIDKELTAELVKAINRYQDAYIAEQFSARD